VGVSCVVANSNVGVMVDALWIPYRERLSNDTVRDVSNLVSVLNSRGENHPQFLRHNFPSEYKRC
jgi:hypothetical protein